MVALITCNGTLVPLREGLGSSNPYTYKHIHDMYMYIFIHTHTRNVGFTYEICFCVMVYAFVCFYFACSRALIVSLLLSFPLSFSYFL